jgi:hypothetical protein
MIGSPLAEPYFGRWLDRITDWRQINPKDHNANLEEMNAREQEEIRRREVRWVEVENIIGHLSAQSQAQTENTIVPPLEEEDDDRVEEVIPSTSTDEECIAADIQQKVVHPSMTKENIATQPPDTSKGIGEKMSRLTVAKSPVANPTRQEKDERRTTAPKKKMQTTRKMRSTSLPRNETDATKNWKTSENLYLECMPWGQVHNFNNKRTFG